MRIGIVGAGTAAAVSLMEIYHYMHVRGIDTSNVQTTLIYDPNIPVTHVGESASSWVFTLLQDFLDLDPAFDFADFDGSIRWSSKYFWKDATGKDFTVKYKVPGIHLNSHKFSFYAIEKISEKFNTHRTIEDSISEFKQSEKSVVLIGEKDNYEFDYVIDCSGTPSQEELESSSYSRPEFIGVNSVLLHLDQSPQTETYTSSHFHKDGWMFGVPLTTRKAYGYCYNNTITQEKDAASNFSKLINVDELQYRKISWDQYYRNKAIENRILYLGNKLYFLEPHQALPLHYYLFLTNALCELIFDNHSLQKIDETINNIHSSSMMRLKNLIALNYIGDNNTESEFWKYAKANAILNLRKSDDFLGWVEQSLANGYQSYWTHSGSMMKEYCEGYNINLNQFI